MPDRSSIAIRSLCTWFGREARDLPWRRSDAAVGPRSAYAALVAESMLQQTQVARVLERYETFMRRFPTVEALAGADVQEVLALWQGLGYYRRARHLHAAARMVVEDFAGAMPSAVADLRALPGIGRYTAGALASIVFGAAEPIVDGNVHRVLARWFADEHEQTRRRAGRASRNERSDAAHAWAWTKAGELVGQAKRPGVFNEALMELGATICTPRAPRCDACPLAGVCEARAAGRQESIPAPRPRPARRSWHHHAVVIRRGHAILFEQRPPTGMWAGMWQTPTIESARALEDAEVEHQLAMRVRDLQIRGNFAHHTTHRLIHVHVFTARSGARASKGRRARPPHAPSLWRDPAGLADLPLSNVQKKVLALLLG